MDDLAMFIEKINTLENKPDVGRPKHREGGRILT